MAEQILTISLKEYKKEIDDLRASLLGLEESSDEYKKTVQEIESRQEKLNSVIVIGKRNTSALEGSYNALTLQMSELRKQWKSTNDEAERNAIGKQINDINDKLKSLDSSIGNFQRNVGNYESGTVSLKEQIRSLQAQMAEMLANGASPTDAAFVELAKKAGEMKDAMADSQAVIANYANDTRGLANLVDLAKTGSAVFGAYQGVMNMFGVENKKATQTMAQLQAIMTTLNSLQTIQTALVDRSSATYRMYTGILEALGLKKKMNAVATTEETVAEGASTVATEAHTGAMVADTVATSSATVATNLFKKALISTGIGAIVVLIGTLIANLDTLFGLVKKGVAWIGDLTGMWHSETEEEKKAAEQAKKSKQAYEELGKKLKEVSESEMQNAMKAKHSFDVAVQAFRGANGEFAKTQALDNLKKSFEDLGISCNGLKDAELLTSKYMPILTQMMDEQGKAAALSAIANQTYAESLNYMFNLMQNSRNSLGTEADMAIAQEYAKAQAKELEKAARESRQRLAELAKQLPSSYTTSKTSTNSKSSTDPLEIDLDALQKNRNDAEKIIEHQYNLMDAAGTATAQNEKDKLESLHQIRVNYFEDVLKRLEKEKNRYKDNSDKYLKILKQETKVKEQQIDEVYKYEEDRIKNTRKLEKEKLEDFKKTYDQYSKRILSISKSYSAITSTHYFPERGEFDFKNQKRDARTEYEFKSMDISTNVDNFREKLQLMEDEYVNMIEDLTTKLNSMEIGTPEFIEAGSEYQELLTIFDTFCTQYSTKWREFLEERNKLKREYDEKMKEINQKEKETNLKTVADGLNAYSNLAGGIADFYESIIDLKVKNGEMSEEEAEKEFERVKALQIAQAVIGMISGAVGAYFQDMKSYPSPWNAVIAGADMATVFATGVAQIHKIYATKYNSGSGSASSSSSMSNGVMSASVNPLLDENLDQNSYTALIADNTSNKSDTRVYVVESDISDTQNKVEVRNSQSTF